MTSGPQHCDYCGAELLGPDALERRCRAPYHEWRKDYDSGLETRVIFVGLAPPKPRAGWSDPIRYFYRFPERSLVNTALLMRDALKSAVLGTSLEVEWVNLTRYFQAEDQTRKEGFLRALKSDGFVWLDCTYHPLPTDRVYNLLDDEEFRRALAQRLSDLHFERMIFMSPLHSPLCRNVEGRLVSSGRLQKSLYVFRMNFWTRSNSVVAQRERGKELYDALTRPLGLA